MAVPNTTTFNMNQVVTEISPTTNDLVDCFADAKVVGFWYLYADTLAADRDDMLQFRNYSHTRTATSKSLGYSASSGAAACAAGTTTMYMDRGSLTASYVIWTSSTGATLANTGYYSDGSVSRHWNKTTGVLSTPVPC